MKKEQLDLVEKVELENGDSLVIVDIQNDFTPGGALAVEEGDEIIDGINSVAVIFAAADLTVAQTQDWHPKDHDSFASSHSGKEPGDPFESNDGAIGPVLWPDHCVQGTNGAEFHKNLNTKYTRAIIRKGYHKHVDSYSAFLENDKKTKTVLAVYLKGLDIKRVYISGLALDYCCYFSALDALDFGFEVYLIVDLTKGIDDPEGNVSRALSDMTKKGVKFVKQESF